MNATGSPHDQVLWALHDLVVDFQKVGLLERLEAKVVVAEIPLVINSLVQNLCIFFDELPYILGQQRSRSALLVTELMQDLAGLRFRVEGAAGFGRQHALQVS